jgi:NADH:ubiquinone oxidoreductase subunit 6 (subunit J)
MAFFSSTGSFQFLGVVIQKQINYRGIFMVGCAMKAAGVILLIAFPFIGISILGTGMTLMAIVLAKRDEWDQGD